MLPAIPTPIPMPFAQNGERRAIPETNTTPGSADASWATGFPPVTRINKQAGGKPPYGLDFQGLFHTICEHLFFSQSGNTVPWVGASDGQPGLNYFKGAVVQGSDGGIYMALKPSGPETPNSDGGGMVGPVDPVGDESGHWINLNILYGGMPNSEEWITESGEWQAKVDGWHEITVWHGGDGAFWDTGHQNGGTGKAYAPLTYLRYYNKGDTLPVTIGAKGIRLITSSGIQASYGGITTVGDLPTEADRAKAVIHMRRAGTNLLYTNNTIMAGVGVGSGYTDGNGNVYPPTFYGSSGAFLYDSNGAKVTDGAQGAVRFRYHDPAKAKGPAPAPALLSARRMATRSVAEPAVVNLYDPETGQGSVWREEDAPAKLAEGLITEEAWLEICTAKAAEERAIWLTNPDTEAERFAMLRAARDAKLSATDYLVAPDYPLTDEQRAAVTSYRQALRDLPAQPGAPWDGGGELTPWPEMPAVSKAQAQE